MGVRHALLTALLIGAIISSTDAAAVFSLLQGRGLHLNERVSATLEIESGSNDPMAIFLTLMLVTMIEAGGTSEGWMALMMLVKQFGIGGAVGVAGGFIVVELANRVRLTPSLYPLLVVAAGIMVFSGTNALGGSGFLAIYLAGVVVGNRPVRMMPMILQVHDGLAWLAQLCLFLMLGLLVTPSELLPLAGGGLVLALALIFLIRPLTVMATLWPFGFNRRELGFISWVACEAPCPLYWRYSRSSPGCRRRSSSSMSPSSSYWCRWWSRGPPWRHWPGSCDWKSPPVKIPTAACPSMSRPPGTTN